MVKVMRQKRKRMQQELEEMEEAYRDKVAMVHAEAQIKMD